MDRTTSYLYSSNGHAQESIQQFNYRNRSHRNIHQRDNNCNNRHHGRDNNRQTNYSYHHYQQPTSQQSMNHNDIDNHDYLNENQIFNWFANQSIYGKFMISDCVTYVYVIVLTSIFDQWIRTDHKRKLWRVYLKLAQEEYYWPPDVLQCTNELHIDTNNKFIQDELHRLDNKITKIIKDFDECISILLTYREDHRHSTATHMLSMIGGLSITETTFPHNQIDKCIDELNDHVHDYVMYCTRHFRKYIHTKIQLAKTQAKYL